MVQIWTEHQDSTDSLPLMQTTLSTFKVTTVMIKYFYMDRKLYWSHKNHT